MAGHSKWSNIKHKKAAEDKKRAKIFSKLSKKIRAAVRESGSGDPEQNASLRPLLDKARDANMPKENIQRAIDVGLGKGENGPLKEVVYEAFGPAGIGLLITALTDNKNRTTPEIRYLLNQAGGSLGAPGSVMYMFKRRPKGGFECTMPLPITDEGQKEKLRQLIDKLRDHEDVEAAYCCMPELNEVDD